VRTARDRALLRFLVSAIGGVAVTIGMLLVGVAINGAFESEPDNLPELEEVELISTLDRVDVAELLAEREREQMRVSQPPPPPQLPPRVVSGFVQLEYDVDATGRVTAVRVLAAVPGGVYEDQAIAEVRSRMYTPEFVDGEAVASTHSDVVEFQVELPREIAVTGEDGTEAGAGGGPQP